MSTVETQSRYHDSNASLTSPQEWQKTELLHPPGVYAGFDVTATGDEEITIAPGDLLFTTGIALRESAPQPLNFTNPVSPTVYTVVSLHSDGGIPGGNVATYEIQVGKLIEVDGGIPIAYIKHPGTGVLSQAMITQIPRVKVAEALAPAPPRFDPDIFLPPLAQGASLSQQAELIVPGEDSPGDPSGDVIYTAVTTGTPGNNVQVAHVVAGLNTPLSVGVVGMQITVNLATDSSGDATSTSAQVVAAVLAFPAAAALAYARSGGDGLAVAGALAMTSLAGGVGAAGTNCVASQVYRRDRKTTEFKMLVGSGATGAETYYHLFRLEVRPGAPPRRVTLFFNGEAGTTTSVIVRDTNGRDVAVSPASVGATGGWIEQDFDLDLVGDGVSPPPSFAIGESWFMILQLSGPVNTAIWIERVEVVYDPIELI